MLPVLARIGGRVLARLPWALGWRVGGHSMARYEKCGYELSAEGERLLAALRAELGRCQCRINLLERKA